ncbi:hypothetical protein M3A49_21420 [Paraburkholderia sp. CNPSo 3076]|nr:hypothetical protein [Paraburkholderia sp. CNPSo 3076]
MNKVADREFALARQHGRTDEERWHLRKDGTRFFASGVLSRLDEAGVSGFAKIARDLGELVPADADVRDTTLEQVRDAGKLSVMRSAVDMREIVQRVCNAVKFAMRPCCAWRTPAPASSRRSCRTSSTCTSRAASPPRGARVSALTSRSCGNS